MLQLLLQHLIVLLVLGIPFYWLERRYATTPTRAWWRAERRVDLAWFLFNSILGKPVAQVLVLLTIVHWSLVTGVQLRELPRLLTVLSARSPIGQIPLPIQFLLGLFLADLLGYWFHRLSHENPWLWRIHSVHHSARSLDWLAAARQHPLEEVLSSCVIALPLLLLGFDVTVFALVGPLLGLHGLLLHTNVPWDFGRFRELIASPRFHRWHHTSQDEGIDKNFSGLFPVWDRIFGTFYLPEHRIAVRFGVDDPMPRTFLGQLLYPFTRYQPAVEAPVQTAPKS